MSLSDSQRSNTEGRGERPQSLGPCLLGACRPPRLCSAGWRDPGRPAEDRPGHLPRKAPAPACQDQGSFAAQLIHY